MKEKILKVLEAHDGLCMDSSFEREKLAQALVAALRPSPEDTGTDFLEWREEVDQDHLLDGFDLCLGFFAGRGFDHDICTEWAEMGVRDR